LVKVRTSNWEIIFKLKRSENPIYLKLNEYIYSTKKFDLMVSSTPTFLYGEEELSCSIALKIARGSIQGQLSKTAAEWDAGIRGD
jgi:hypothetical protein